MQLKNTSLYDFMVIGCGPAGSTVATKLIRKGYSVLVFERTKFPRQHEGESLLPFCYPIFKELGVWDELKKHFVRKPGARFTNYDGKQSCTWFFKSVIPDESHLSFNVERAYFDDILMRNAIKNGVVVLEETKVEAVDKTRPDGLVAVSTVNKAGERQTWMGKYIIDASGQETFLAKRDGTKNAYQELDRIAWLGHWKGAHYKHGAEQGLIDIVHMGSGKKGWFAIQPVGKDLISLTMIVERQYMKEQKKLLMDMGIEDWQEAFYLKEIHECPVTQEVLCDAHMRARFVVVSDYSYFSDIIYGDNFALIGDSYKFLDPIFSTGVYLAMKSADLFAEAIHLKLNSDKETGDQKLEETFKTIRGAYDLVEEFINIYYDPATLNLAELHSQASSNYEGYEEAFSLIHFLLAGDFFDNYDRYAKFLDMIKNPLKYEQWKSLIVDSVFDADKYHFSYDEIFGDIIDKT